MANYTKKALKGVSIFFIMSLLAGFIGYLVRLVFARNLTQADYGLFYAVFAFYGMLLIFRDIGLREASVKYISEFNAKKKYGMIKGIIWITFITHLIVSIVILGVIFLLSDNISMNLFHTQGAKIVLFLLAGMFVLRAVENIFYFTYQGFQKFHFNSLIEFTRMSLVLVLVFIGFMYSKSIVVACLAYILAHILENLVLVPLFLKTFPKFFKVKAVLSTDLFKKLLFFGMPVMIGLVGSMIITYVDTIAITYFMTLEDVALYQVAMPTAKLLLYFTVTISLVVLPMSSELWTRKLKKKLVMGMDILYRYSFFMVIPFALLMFAFPDIIIRVFFGQKYVEASLVLQILALAGIIYTVAFINSNVISGIGRPKENTKIILFAAVFNLVLDVILVPKMGIEGAAIATFLSYLLMLVLTALKMKSIVDVHAPWMHWLKNFFAGFIFLAFMYYAKNRITFFGDFTEMIIVGLAGCLVYLLLSIALKVIDLKEIKGIISYAVKK